MLMAKKILWTLMRHRSHRSIRNSKRDVCIVKLILLQIALPCSTDARHHQLGKLKRMERVLATIQDLGYHYRSFSQGNSRSLIGSATIHVEYRSHVDALNRCEVQKLS